MSYNIPISGLNELIIISSDDFFPIVDSSSLTTFRVSVNNLGNYLAPASTSWASHSLSADSSSWSSQSLSASWANNAAHINLTGSQYYYPFWFSDKTLDGFETNGCLKGIPTPYGSQLFNYVGGSPDTSQNVVVAGPYRIFLPPTQYTEGTAGPGTRTDYYVSSSWNPWANTLEGQMGYGAMGGIWTSFPIISPMFVGTDQMSWNFATASYNNGAVYSNQFWSGSCVNGSWKTIPGGGGITDGISSSFNKKWVRIVSNGYIYPTVTDGASKGEISTWDGLGLFGRIRLWVKVAAPLTSLSVGSGQLIDMHITNRAWSGGISATVHSSVPYGNDIIKKIRLSKWFGPNGDPLKDPQWAMDLFIDGIEDEIEVLSIMAQSWGGVKFLQVLNVDPDPLVNTGSADIHNSEMLIFPPAAGHYGTYTNKQNYFLQGHNVVINPTYNETTESFGLGNPLFSTHSLNVSGTINTNCYYCGDHQGLTTTLTIGGVDMHFSGGILVSGAGGGPTAPPESPIGSMVVWPSQTIPANWLICSGSILPTASYLALYNAIKTTSTYSTFGRLCNSGGVISPTGIYFKIPNMKGHFAEGWDGSSTTFGTIGTTGGSTSVSHTHQFSAWLPIGGAGMWYISPTQASSVTVPYGIPPYTQINWIIKYALSS